MGANAAHDRAAGPAVVIGRRPGEGIYIGREVRITVLDPIMREGRAWAQIRIEAPAKDAVTATNHPIAEHVTEQDVREADPGEEDHDGNDWILGENDGVRVGRGIVVTLAEMERDGYVRLKVEASRRMAVTRDDYSFDEHMKFQGDRERGRYTVPGRAD